MHGATEWLKHALHGERVHPEALAEEAEGAQLCLCERRGPLLEVALEFAAACTAANVDAGVGTALREEPLE